MTEYRPHDRSEPRAGALSYVHTSWDAYRAGHADPEGIARRQRQRLADLIDCARGCSTFYRRLYHDVPEQISSITQLPTVTKAELMSQFDDWVTDPAVTKAAVLEFLADQDNVGRDYLDRYVVCTTSGATGTPAILLHDHAALMVYNVLGYVRSVPPGLIRPKTLWRMLRGRFRLAAVFATGGHFLGNTMLTRRARTIPWRAKTQRIFSAQAPIAELVADLNTFQPVVLGGYPSALRTLAREQHAGRLHLDPELISSAGETLTTANRLMISEAFGCHVANYYGASEAVGLTFECTAQRLHANTDWYIIEPVDEHDDLVAPGELSADVLITNLANRIQPVIRYRLGDRVTIDADPCTCGSPFPTIGVVGRTNDTLSFIGSNGAPVRVLPLAIVTVAEQSPGVAGCQFLQSSPSSLTVRLLVDSGADEQEVWATLRERLVHFLTRQGVDAVDIEKSSEPLELHPRSGKFRQVRSEVEVPQES